MKYISIFLASFSVIMCLMLAYFLIFDGILEETLYGAKRTILIVILLSYAVFRVFRMYKMYQKIKNHEASN